MILHIGNKHLPVIIYWHFRILPLSKMHLNAYLVIAILLTSSQSWVVESIFWGHPTLDNWFGPSWQWFTFEMGQVKPLKSIELDAIIQASFAG
jgi:hypothetical protein